MARIEAEREAGVHFRPGYEYGPGPEDLQYSLYGPDGAPFYNYLGPEDAVPEQPFPNTASHPGDHAPGPESPLQPSELQPHYVASHPGVCCCKNGGEAGTRSLHFHLPHLLVPSPPPARVRTGWGGKTHQVPSPGHSREGTALNAHVTPSQLPARLALGTWMFGTPPSRPPERPCGSGWRVRDSGGESRPTRAAGSAPSSPGVCGTTYSAVLAGDPKC